MLKVNLVNIPLICRLSIVLYKLMVEKKILIFKKKVGLFHSAKKRKKEKNMESIKLLTNDQINDATHAFITTSDVGCLAIGTDGWRIRIHNGYGDTDCNRVYVFDHNINIDSKYFVTDTEGEFNIYDYDCKSAGYRQANSCITLNGHYNIYRGVKTFAFVKI